MIELLYTHIYVSQKFADHCYWFIIAIGFLSHYYIYQYALIFSVFLCLFMIN